MKNISYRDSLYAPFGGFLLNEDSFSAILLKKRYTSVVYCPNHEEREPGAMYPRAIVLEHNGEHNGKILTTFECYTNKTPVFPIYESDDNARSWKLTGKVEDNEKQFGCRYQPHLYEMPCDSGKLTEGTILCAGNIIPEPKAYPCGIIRYPNDSFISINHKGGYCYAKNINQLSDVSQRLC